VRSSRAVRRALALSFLSAVVLAPAAHAQVPYGNVVPVTLPAPNGNEVVLARVRVQMEIDRRLRPRPASIGPLTVRRAGGGVARGYAVAAVRARPRGNLVTVRLGAVRTGSRSVRRLRLRLRIGTARAAFRTARTRTVALAPRRSVRRLPDCAAIGAEAARRSLVRGLASVRIGGERFGARAAVGAAQQHACGRPIAAVPAGAAERFLLAVHPAFAGGPGSPVEGFFATWARGADGRARVCVFVRGRPRGTGDVTVGTITQPFVLDADRGVARTQTDVPGEGEYQFTVRWRQADGTFRSARSTLRVPAVGTRGTQPPAPYSAAGSCR
jgi:hypothetical protein